MIYATGLKTLVIRFLKTIFLGSALIYRSGRSKRQTDFAAHSYGIELRYAKKCRRHGMFVAPAVNRRENCWNDWRTIASGLQRWQDKTSFLNYQIVSFLNY